MRLNLIPTYPGFKNLPLTLIHLFLKYIAANHTFHNIFPTHDETGD